MSLPPSLQKPATIAALVCGIIAGIGAIVAAIVFKKVAFSFWGVVFIAGSVIAFASGAKGTPDGSLSGPRIGAKFTEIPGWAWAVIVLLFVAAVVLTFLFPPWG